MSKCTLRSIFTVLIYAGVVIFLFPYFIGRLTNVGFYVLAGLGLAVVCGILRCCCTEGEATAPTLPPPNPPTTTPPRTSPSRRIGCPIHSGFIPMRGRSRPYPGFLPCIFLQPNCITPTL